MSGERTADRIWRGGRVITLAGGMAQAVATCGDEIVAVGSDTEVSALAGELTQVTELHGRTLMPGLIDGHAHADREGLKTLLPSLAGCRSVADVVERIREIAGRTPPGRWIVTMPLGEPPEYRVTPQMFAEGRLPDRHDLDAASSLHPVLIRCAWGYWPGVLPTVSIANSAALRLAGVDCGTVSPSRQLEIERDAAGEPTGRFFEHAFQPIAEFTFVRCAPQFTADDRLRTIEASMRAYNEVGTTGVFEGHGVSGEVVDAWRSVRASRRGTLRAHLLVSPSFGNASLSDVTQWVLRESKRLRSDPQGDEWLRLQGFFAEPAVEPGDARLRAACAPQTGWAGFHYDAGVPPEHLRALLDAAARERLRVCVIQTRMADVLLDVARDTPIAGLRWVVAHPATLDARQVAGIADNGIVVTTHTNAYISRGASALRDRIGAARENEICPIRSLLDAGVKVSLASDNVPVSLWPCVWQAVERIDRETGRVVAPEQRITREEALQCATSHGAWLCGDEGRRGTLEAGKLADMIVLPEDPLTMPAGRIASLRPDETIVGGRTVHKR